jgi:UDP-N-acetylmuramoyl-tripeptide--D-alanyl-D-alanine ligase
VLLVGKGETRYEMSSEQTAPLSDMDMAGETLAALQNQQKEKDDGRIMGSLEDFRAACAGVFLQGETAGQTPVVGVSTDTRTVCAGELFVALSGERFDAHDYLQTAEGRGACAVVVDNEEKWRAAALHLPTILVANTLAAYEAIAAWYRKRLAAQVIGVTGSVGKTGTRDMIAAALEPSFRVVRTAGNLNNEIGLSATLLGVAEEAEVVVAEMGIGGPGEMERLADIAKPDIAILTMIGYSHIEHLKRLEETRIEKSKIADALPAGGWLLLNLDDPLLCRTATERRGTGIRIGGISIRDRATEAASERPPIDLLLEADELERTPNGTSFRVRYHTGEAPAGQREIRVVLEVNGQHHVRNALFGLLCAELLGAEAEQAAEGLRNYQPTGNRQNISVHDGVTVINDTYNASAESMFAGFEVMQDLAEQNAGARMVCVLGSINELGSYAEAIHTDIGRKLAGYKPSIVYTCGAYGEVLAAVCASELYGKYNADIRFFENRDQLISTLLDQLRRGDIVFVKGSRSYKMEDVCTAIEQNRGGTNHG